jgi:hypothetical protein
MSHTHETHTQTDTHTDDTQTDDTHDTHVGEIVRHVGGVPLTHPTALQDHVAGVLVVAERALEAGVQLACPRHQERGGVRDGERWREMERDGERWREMERDGDGGGATWQPDIPRTGLLLRRWLP